MHSAKTYNISKENKYSYLFKFNEIIELYSLLPFLFTLYIYCWLEETKYPSKCIKVFFLLFLGWVRVLFLFDDILKFKFRIYQPKFVIEFSGKLFIIHLFYIFVRASFVLPSKGIIEDIFSSFFKFYRNNQKIPGI